MTYEDEQDDTLTTVAQEGDTLAVGETVARIGEGGESNGAAPAEREAEEGGGDEGGEAETATATAEAPAEPRDEAPEETTEPEEPSAPEPSEGGGNGRIKASPIARRMARE